MWSSGVRTVRIWFSMTPVSGHAAEVRVMVMTAMLPLDRDGADESEVNDVHPEVGIDDLGQRFADGDGGFAR